MRLNLRSHPQTVLPSAACVILSTWVVNIVVNFLPLALILFVCVIMRMSGVLLS